MRLILFVFARRAPEDGAMSDHVYKKIELVGSSPTSIEEAVANALSRAQKTIRNMRWFEVTETRGQIEEGKVNHWQVTVKVGFTLDK
jgi:flavin-binding protein dodecin